MIFAFYAKDSENKFLLKFFRDKPWSDIFGKTYIFETFFSFKIPVNISFPSDKQMIPTPKWPFGKNQF